MIKESRKHFFGRFSDITCSVSNSANVCRYYLNITDSKTVASWGVWKTCSLLHCYSQTFMSWKTINWSYRIIYKLTQVSWTMLQAEDTSKYLLWVGLLDCPQIIITLLGRNVLENAECGEFFAGFFSFYMTNISDFSTARCLCYKTFVAYNLQRLLILWKFLLQHLQNFVANFSPP